MTKLMALGAVLGGAMLLAAPALAVDVENADEDSYSISVTQEGADSASMTIGPDSMLAGICSARCTVQVEGVGTIEAEENEVVLIRDKQLTKERKDL